MKIWNKKYFHANVDDTGGGGDDAGEDTNEGANENLWPDTWREAYAGEDESKLARLSRYASPTAAFDALFAAQHKITSGEFKQVTEFPEKGTDEEKAAWRESNGIPPSPDKYDLADVEITDETKEEINDFLASAHAANMSPSDAKAAVQWFYQNQARQEEARLEKDEEIRGLAEDALRAEWGNEYRANINRINGLLDTAPEEIRDGIMNARLPDGTPVFSDPNAMKFFADLALQINPATTLVPGAGDNISGAIDDEIKTIETLMGNKSSEYWKGPKAEGMQQRYRQLIEARDKMKK